EAAREERDRARVANSGARTREGLPGHLGLPGNAVLARPLPVLAEDVAAPRRAGRPPGLRADPGGDRADAAVRQADLHPAGVRGRGEPRVTGPAVERGRPDLEPGRRADDENAERGLPGVGVEARPRRALAVAPGVLLREQDRVRGAVREGQR